MGFLRLDYLVAKIILDLEAIEKNIEHLKAIIDEKKEKYIDWKKHFTRGVS